MSRPLHGGRPAVALALGALLAALATLLAAAPAHPAGYRYWSFWVQQGDSWTYASQGPSTLHVDDGDVLGFRFSVSEDSADAAKPRAEAEFTAICGDTDRTAGTVRTAVVLDFGTAADAPPGEKPPKRRTACARVDEAATAGEALASVAKPLRYDSAALLCAIDGYPEKGCGEQVSGSDGTEDRSAGEAADAQDTDAGGAGTVGVAVGVGAVVVLAAAAVWHTRRRRQG